MYSQIRTSMLDGICAMPVQVEVDISMGMPVFDMVGYLSPEVREAKERVRTALHNCGILLPAKRITVNLSPANIRKTGTGFDLPIAVALLVAMGLVKPEKCADTITSNLKFGGDHITDADAEQAAEIAQATEFISAKPEGFDSPIAQGGSNVSGGQKQRLSIARAIAKHPQIYLFDDSFSALDYKTDVALRRALKAKTDNATVIIVAQRISTVLHANQILVLDEGRIVGKGTHAQLMESCPAYQEIARSQLSQKELNLQKEGE